MPSTTKVSVALDTETLEEQIAILRAMCSQIGFALDNALAGLKKTATRTRWVYDSRENGK